jgi:hypothetical protein
MSLRFLMPLALGACGVPLKVADEAPDPVDDTVEDAGEAAEPPAEASFGPAAFARLTTAQYRKLLDELLGPVPEVELQSDTNPYLFSTIGAATEPLSEQGVELLEQGISTIVADIFADPARREALVGCVPESAADACVVGFVERFGRLAWRRPLDADERALWLSVSEGLGGDDPWLGLATVTAGLLQSPTALYRVELGVDDPEHPGERLLTGYEVATRMSLLLWNGPPDDVLLDAAAAGELDTAAGRRSHTERMLADPRAEEAIEAFFVEYLDLGRLDNAAPDPASFPAFSEPLRAAMRAEVLLLVDDLVNRRDTDVRQLFYEKRAYVNSTLATHYGLPTDGLSALSYAPVDLPEDSPRSGILGLGAFLTMNARPVATSPTLRGKYIVERVLCGTVPPPPDDVDTVLEEGGEEAETLREALDQHRDDPACNGCHQIMDPPGYLFENFDPVGSWRDDDNGHPIDASGALAGVELDGAGELGLALADNPAVGACMVKQLFRHAHARLDTETDDVTLDQLTAGFVDSGHRFRPLLVELVAHESFVRIGPPESDAAGGAR